MLDPTQCQLITQFIYIILVLFIYPLISELLVYETSLVHSMDQKSQEQDHTVTAKICLTDSYHPALYHIDKVPLRYHIWFGT